MYENNVRMRKARCGLGVPQKTPAPNIRRCMSEAFGDHFDGDLAGQQAVFSQVDRTETAMTQRAYERKSFRIWGHDLILEKSEHRLPLYTTAALLP